MDLVDIDRSLQLYSQSHNRERGTCFLSKQNRYAELAQNFCQVDVETLRIIREYDFGITGLPLYTPPRIDYKTIVSTKMKAKLSQLEQDYNLRKLPWIERGKFRPIIQFCGHEHIKCARLDGRDGTVCAGYFFGQICGAIFDGGELSPNSTLQYAGLEWIDTLDGHVK